MKSDFCEMLQIVSSRLALLLGMVWVGPDHRCRRWGPQEACPSSEPLSPPGRPYRTSRAAGAAADGRRRSLTLFMLDTMSTQAVCYVARNK